LGVEPLEGRLLLSASHRESQTDVDGTLFFSANDGVHGFELWKSNGTAAGTVLVKDIDPGSANSSPRNLTDVGGTLFFEGDDGTHGPELWRSDGTAAGTFMVKDINPGSPGSYPDHLTAVGGTLFFSADDGVHGPELWKSDGTAAGTVLVKDIFPGSSYDYRSGRYLPNSSNPRYLTAVDGRLYFSAIDGTHGDELWTSDGTSKGTVLVKDIFPGGSGYFNPHTDSYGYSSSPRDLTAVGGTLFFSANDGVHGFELWKSDGTAAGTVLVKDINPTTRSFGGSYGFGYGSSPRDLTAVGGTLFFSANDGSHGVELWRSNGKAADTVLVKDINPGSTGSYIDDLTAVDGRLFFSADDGVHGSELWKSDGTAAGTVLVKDINPTIKSGYEYGSFPRSLTAVGETLFFLADDGTHGFELWKSDGKAAGTVLVKDINPGSGNGSYYGNLTAMDGTLFLEADDGTHGAELWKSGGTAADTVLVKDINPGGAGSYPSLLTVSGGHHEADDGAHGDEPRDPPISPAPGPALVLDAAPGPLQPPRVAANRAGVLAGGALSRSGTRTGAASAPIGLAVSGGVPSTRESFAGANSSGGAKSGPPIGTVELWQAHRRRGLVAGRGPQRPWPLQALGLRAGG
jgi:ELWxxDGT repeat protein